MRKNRYIVYQGEFPVFFEGKLIKFNYCARVIIASSRREVRQICTRNKWICQDIVFTRPCGY